MLWQQLADLNLLLSEEQKAGYLAFEEALYQANQVMNLTRVPREEAGTRHFLDSLLFHDLIPVGSRILDLGTGPGLPAWPIALARPDLQVVALDSNTKMLGFLRKHPLPNLEVVLARAEEYGNRETFDVVTGRAVSPLPAQLELSAPPTKIGGMVIPMRTPKDDFEGILMAPLGIRLKEVVLRMLPGTDIERAFPIYTKVAATQKRFPRKWADIKNSPL